MIDEESYDPFTRFYDLEFPERLEESKFYSEYAVEMGAPVLELGCGTGKVLIPVAKSHIEIWGLDISQDMLNIANRKIQALPKEVASKITLMKGDMRDFSLPKKFNLIISPFGPFHSLVTIDDQKKALRCIHKHLSKKGLLIVDLISPSLHAKAKRPSPKIMEDKKGRKIRVFQHGEDDFSTTPPVIRIYREYLIELKDGTIKKQTWQETGCYITKEGFEELLKQEGFNVLNVFRNFDKEPYDEKIPSNMFFIAEPI